MRSYLSAHRVLGARRSDATTTTTAAAAAAAAAGSLPCLPRGRTLVPTGWKTPLLVRVVQGASMEGVGWRHVDAREAHTAPECCAHLRPSSVQ